MIMSPVEIIEAETARQNMWHLQNAVNANFFVSVHQALGTKLKGGEDITRQHLYLLPYEEKPVSNYIDANTPEERKRIEEMIKNA